MTSVKLVKLNHHNTVSVKEINGIENEKKTKFPVNVTKAAVFYGSGHIY